MIGKLLLLMKDAISISCQARVRLNWACAVT